MGGPIPDFVHDYDNNKPGMDSYFRGSGCDSELRELKKFMINDSGIN